MTKINKGSTKCPKVKGTQKNTGGWLPSNQKRYDDFVCFCAQWKKFGEPVNSCVNDRLKGGHESILIQLKLCVHREMSFRLESYFALHFTSKIIFSETLSSVGFEFFSAGLNFHCLTVSKVIISSSVLPLERISLGVISPFALT